MRAAGGGSTATIEVRSKGGSFRALTTVKTDSRGYFAKGAANAKDREWRLVWTAPDGQTYRGTPTLAYAG